MNRTKIFLIIALCALAAWAYKLNTSPSKEIHELPSKPLEIIDENNISELALDLSTSNFVAIAKTTEEKLRLDPKTKENELDIIPNEYVLRFKNNKDKASFVSEAKSKGITILDTLDLVNAVRIRVNSPEQLKKFLAESSLDAEYSHNYYVLPPEQPLKDPKKPESGYIGFGNKSLEWLGARGDNSAWGKGITVAILDTKIYGHPALDKSKIKYIDLINKNFDTNDEYSGHGTAVASLIAGSSDQVTGIAPASDLLNIKVLSEEGVGDSFTLAKGIVIAVNNDAKIINICIGTYGNSFVLQEAVNFALDRNVVIVAATGNDAVEGVTYPAKYEGVIGVSSVDASGKHLYFANRGEEVDLAAPGIGITAAWTGNTFTDFSGTSASAPFVSGTIAMLLSQNPGMTPSEATGILSSYANDAGFPGKDDDFGNGIIDVRRIQERDTKGINDAAIGMPIMQENDNGLSLIAHFQNRGTERIIKATLSVNINGAVETFPLYNIQVGQTVSHTFHVSDSIFQNVNGARVTSSVRLDTIEDTYPENNSKKTVLLKVN